MKRFVFLVIILQVFASICVYGQSIAPVNPDFTNYLYAKSNNIINYQTEEGYFLGEIPSPVVLNFSNLGNNGSSPKFAQLYDLRAENGGSWLSPVRDQGLEGACWAFATYGAVESHWLKNGLAQADLSEQNLATCHGFDNTPSEGGHYYFSTAYLARRAGPIDESDDPYTLPSNPTCVSGYTPVAYVDQARFLPGQSDSGYSNDLIKQSILDYGAIYISMFFDNDYMSYSNYTYYYNGSEGTNHGVLLVGWDDNKVVTGGSAATPSSPGAWIIRNSWGPSWGEAGYFYISYEDTEALSTVAYFPSTNGYNNESSVYGYGELGMCSSFGWGDGDDYGLIKFTAQENQTITSLGSYVVDANSNISFDIYENFNGTTLSGLLGSISGQSCVFPGYYSFELSTPIPITSGSDYYVRVRYYNASEYNIPIEASFVDYSSNAVIETGKCWISNNGSSWMALGADTDYDYDLTINAYAENIPVGIPSANFTASSTTVMVGQPVVFTDLSTGVPDTWNWTFEQATPPTSQDQHPTVTWAQPGTYDVSLTVSNSYGPATETKYNFITVISAETVCDTMENIYTDDNLVYYTLAGGYMTGQNDYNMDEYAEYYSNPLHNNLSGIVMGVAIAQANTPNPIVRCKVWDDNSGVPGSVLYTEDFDTGSFTEMAYNEITFSTEVNVPDQFYVGYQIFYDTPISDTFCIFVAQVRDAASIYPSTAYTVYDGSWWNTDDLFEGGFNTSYAIYPILCPHVPEADFTADITEACEQLEVQFTDQSLHNPTSWYWDFGDGENSIEQNPIHIYENPGTYTVSLTATNSQGSDEYLFTDLIQVHSNPTIDLGEDIEQCGGSVTLDAGAGFDIYTWNGTTGNQTHAVSASDTYTVVVVDANGCTGTDAVDVTINDLPTVDLGDDVEQCGSSVTLDAASGFDTYTWNGTTGNQTHTVSTSDTYTVVVVDANGCTGTDAVDVTIHDLPTVDLGGDFNICNGTSETLDAGSGFVSYEWNGTVGTQTLLIDAADIYTVVVEDDNGCIATDNVSVGVNPSPTLILEMTEESSAGAGDGTATAIAENGTPAYQYAWDFGGFVTNVVTGLNAGTYCVTVNDFNGCTVSDCIIVTIADQPTPPVADFTADITEWCGQLTVQFTDQSTNNPTSWTWDFGDGSGSNLESPTHTYSLPGTYTVSLTVSNDDGTSDPHIKTDYIIIHEVPLIDAGDDFDVCGPCTQLDCTSAGFPGSWQPINGIIFDPDSQDPHAEVCSSIYGSRSFIWIENNGPCSARDTVIVTFWEEPISFITTQDTSVCGNCFEELEVSSENSIDGFWFIPTDPTAQFWTEDSEDPDTVCVTTFGVHTLYYISMNGPEYAEPDFCNDTAWVNITFNANPVLAFETTDESEAGASDGEIVLSITEGLPPYDITWSNNEHTETISNLSAGVYSVTVIDDNDCVAESSDIVDVYNAINRELLGNLSVFPNPTHDIVSISSSVEITNIEIYDALGRKVFIETINGMRTELDLSKFAAGTYMLNVKFKDAIDVKKQIIKK